MNNPAILFILVILTGCGTPPGRHDALPNIVILFVDDLGYYDVGFRNSQFHTPNIDRLAEESTIFENAYVPSPTCSPSRVGLYTGQHPARLQFYRHVPGDGLEDPYHAWEGDTSLLLSRNWLPLEVTTYAEVLKTRGYHTFFAGKWHLGDESFGPSKQGFDSVWSKSGSGMPRSYYHPYFNGSGFWNEIPDNQYLTDFYTDRVIDYLSGYVSEQPFLIQFSYHNVHKPSVGRKDFLELYRERGFEGPLIEYGAQVSAVDASVGRVLETLQETGLDRNTLVILTSDQGSFFPNLPLRGTKAIGTTLYEGGQKVPFMVRWPGKVEPGKKIRTHVQTSDIFPTLCEIVGEDPGQFQGLEGVSLHELLTTGKEPDRDAIFAFRSYDGQFASVLASDNWKLVAYRDGQAELYKVDEDISEQHDLAGQYPAKVRELQGKLERWLEITGVPIGMNESSWAVEGGYSL
jgi:arylsulfatase A-like enzyme